MSWRVFSELLTSPHFLSNFWSPSCSCTSTLLYGLVIGVLVGLLIPLVCSRAFLIGVLKAWLAQQSSASPGDNQQAESSLSEPRRRIVLGRQNRGDLALPSSSSQGPLDERTLKRIQSLRYAVPAQND